MKKTEIKDECIWFTYAEYVTMEENGWAVDYKAFQGKHCINPKHNHADS